MAGRPGEMIRFEALRGTLPGEPTAADANLLEGNGSVQDNGAQRCSQATANRTISSLSANRTASSSSVTIPARLLRRSLSGEQRPSFFSAPLSWIAYRCNCSQFLSRRDSSDGTDSRTSSLIREEPLSQTALTLVSRILAYTTLSDKSRKDLETLKKLLQKIDEQEKFEENALTVITHSDFVDQATQEWLVDTFGGKSVHHEVSSFRKAAHVIRAGKRMQKLMMLTRSSTKEALQCPAKILFDESLNQDLDMLGSWAEFDIFRLTKCGNGRPLFPVAYSAFMKRGLIDRFRLPERKLEIFFNTVEDKYSSTNPYHNAVHAADVTQTAYMLLADLNLSELENLAALLAAACHDVGHPGVTNDFRIKAADEDAITYSDKSVNEFMHCALTYRFLRREDCSFLALLSEEQRASIRKLVVGIILSTDMAMHFTQLQKFKTSLETKGKDSSKWDDTPLVLETLVHAADISGVSKPRPIALQWTDRVLEEFFAQGDQERNMKRDISPLCDRHTVSKANAQVGFIGFIVKPTFEAFGRIANVPIVQEALQNINSYHDYWQKHLESEPRRKSQPGTTSSKPQAPDDELTST